MSFQSGIQFLLYSHLVCSFKVKFSGSQWALLHRSSEKNWQLLTKFIINSGLTVEEKICHKK
ncbi:hypothetical protein [Wolbachia endosymbiont (group A) of Gastracanthus pulcherrimus]|uniref:hypothetical protein n=1 Tax=Wolbachia endosymbiont (group A) of Gastracanthus pulcherrimus TaxID=3066200 RepID=UPI003977FC5F